jgi:hypothetical protein
LQWLSFLVYYQQSFSKDDDDNWLLEQKLSINLNTSVTLSHFKFANQLRYEYRIMPDWHDYRLKNNLVISLKTFFSILIPDGSCTMKVMIRPSCLTECNLALVKMCIKALTWACIIALISATSATSGD